VNAGLRRGLGAVVAAGLTLFVVAFSRRPWTAAATEDGELRLAWRFKSERTEACRRRSAEELAQLPVHMRRETVCEPQLRPYLLEVMVDGAPALTDTVRPRGARADRPLGVFERLPLAPGRHDAHVTFRGLGPDSGAAPFTWTDTFVVSPRQVVVVTLDEREGRLRRVTREELAGVR
jgi:hypothetical protein